MTTRQPTIGRHPLILDVPAFSIERDGIVGQIAGSPLPRRTAASRIQTTPRPGTTAPALSAATPPG